MNIRFPLVVFTTALMMSCGGDEPVRTERVTETHIYGRSSRPETVTATNGSCFNKGTMYSDGAVSCQEGSQYKCSGGEWESLGTNCAAQPIAASRTCQFAGVTFATGAASCQAGTQYRCEDGIWRSLAISCPGVEPSVRIVPGGRTCMFSDVTVATNSTVCRSGTTFLCNDGEWVNLGTLCR